MCLAATVMFMTNSMLLWWTLDSYSYHLQASRKLQRKLCNGVASASAKLRQSNGTDKRIELTMQLLRSC